MKLKIGYVGPVEGHEEVIDVFKDVAEVSHLEALPSVVSTFLETAHGFLDASMKVKITDDMVERASNLKIISCATTGSDHIERNMLEAKGIPVKTLKEDRDLLLNITPAAELSWALLMSCARHLPAAVEDVKKGNWIRENFPGIMLNGKTLGIVGCGRLGSWMARYAIAFGMKVLGYDPYLDTLPDGICAAVLDDLVASSDFLSIHVHLSNETEGLISKDLLEKSKQGIIIINTSRGAIIDQNALLDGLKSGHIGGAGLDVLKGEPDINKHPLVEYARKNDNVLITPHCGGYSPDAVRVVCRHAAQKILKQIRL